MRTVKNDSFDEVGIARALPQESSVLAECSAKGVGRQGDCTKVSIRLLLCATSVCSVSLWLFFLSNNEPQSTQRLHREERVCPLFVQSPFSLRSAAEGRNVSYHFRSGVSRPGRSRSTLVPA